MHSDLDYAKLKKRLPKNIIPGFDGMTSYYRIKSICFVILSDIGVIKELNVSCIFPSLLIKIL